MSVVEKRPSARLDIIEIWKYIADDDPFRADLFLDKLEEMFGKLAETPYIGLARDELVPGLRSFSIGKYIVYYLAIANGIEVVRVLSGYRDLSDLFPSE